MVEDVDSVPKPGTKKPDAVTQSVSKEQLDFRFAGSKGRPFVGNAPMLTSDEYDDKIITRVKVGYGTFDTSDPEDKHCGRTLGEIYNLAAANQFRMVHVEHRWEESPEPDENSGLRTKMLVYIVWQERADTTQQGYWSHVKQNLGS